MPKTCAFVAMYFIKRNKLLKLLRECILPEDKQTDTQREERREKGEPLALFPSYSNYGELLLSPKLWNLVLYHCVECCPAVVWLHLSSMVLPTNYVKVKTCLDILIVSIRMSAVLKLIFIANDCWQKQINKDSIITYNIKNNISYYFPSLSWTLIA